MRRLDEQGRQPVTDGRELASRGDILRWWRSDVSSLSQRELADRLGVARTAVTNWESGARMASVDAARIDDALEADGVLLGLLGAFDSPVGLPARRVWSHAFVGPSSPVWIWVRALDPSVELEIVAEWGMYRVSGSYVAAGGGIMVSVGASIEASPLIVQLSAPGWVDFGRGSVPAVVPGMAVIDALERFSHGSAGGRFNELLSSEIAGRVSAMTPEMMDRLPEDDRVAIEAFLASLEQAAAETPSESNAWPTVREGSEAEDRSAYYRLREARHLSLAEVVQLLDAETDVNIGKDTLRRFESGVGLPHDRLLPIALDHVLRADGHLTNMEVASGRGAGTVLVPRYWQGPMWIELAPTDDERRSPRADSTSEVSGRALTSPSDQHLDPNGVTLQWGSWRRRIDGPFPLLAVSHSAMHPLRIEAAPTTGWRVGVGRPANARPINSHWYPDSLTTAQKALSVYRQRFDEALEHAADVRRP